MEKDNLPLIVQDLKSKRDALSLAHEQLKKTAMTDTKGLIKYSDINRKTRIYKTAKSFFRILKISSADTKLYFK